MSLAQGEGWYLMHQVGAVSSANRSVLAFRKSLIYQGTFGAAGGAGAKTSPAFISGWVF